MIFIFSVKHSCKECGMTFPTEEKKSLHCEVCEDKVEIVALEPPKKKRRPPPALIPL